MEEEGLAEACVEDVDALCPAFQEGVLEWLHFNAIRRGSANSPNSAY
jgi:hypothetical protein